MPTFDTSSLDEKALKTIDADRVSWIYNGLDCCVTLEVYERLMEELAEAPDCVTKTYEEALAKQAPFMEMSMRGIRMDFKARDETIEAFEKDLAALDSRFQRIMVEVWGERLNWRSPLQLKNLFYGMLGMKEIKKRNAKGLYVASVDEDALEKLRFNFFAEPLVNYVLAMRSLQKSISFLRTGIDPDGRFRTSLNIAGTVTGRSASRESDFGSGSNLQNVNTTLRYPFISDHGKILVNVDLEQADARNLGAIIWNLFLEEHGPEEAGRFLDFCESGDLHTNVCRMCWQELDWGTENWRAVADQVFSADGTTYRDMAKRLGHGSNYLGTPRTMASHTKTPVKIIEDFQKRYFSAFPLIPAWHRKRIEEIKTTGVLTTLFGRRRFFFGRGDDAKTHRDAIAYEPQSMTGHEMDMGILNLWRKLPDVELLIQVHDSILFQVPYDGHAEYVNAALELLRFPVLLKNDREFCVPLEAKVGWNWGDVQLWNKKDVESGKCKQEQLGKPKSNPYGLMKWKGTAQDRERPNPTRRLKDYLR